MRKHLFIFIKILFFLSCYISLEATAAQRVALNNTSFTKLTENISINLDPYQALSKSQAKDYLNFISARIDQNQIKHIRLKQYYLNVPILGGDVIVHTPNTSPKNIANNSDLNRVNGTMYQDLAADLGSVAPYNKQLAADTLAVFTKKWQNMQIVEHKILPIIYLDANTKAHWAYHIELLILNDNALPQRPSAIIDVTTLQPFVTWDNIKNFRKLTNSFGFGGNQKTGLVKYGVDLPFLKIFHDAFFDTCYMENYEVKVVDMQNHYIADNLPMTYNCTFSPQNNAYWTGYDNDGYDKINGAYSTSNDALYLSSIIKEMYRKIYKVEPLVHKGEPQKLIMRVHYGKNYANAFWDGKQMSFGDGDFSFYPLVSLSIAAHEISHGFTEQHSNLVYFGQSGAINESFSDMAAQAAEYYVYKKNSWMIGHEIIKSASPLGAIRFMDNPSLDKHSIEFAHHYRDGMDVHYSSGVYNKLFYLIATTANWDTQKAFEVMLKANMDYWTPTVSFNDAACGIIYAAKDLKYSEIDVKNALEELIIDYDQC